MGTKKSEDDISDSLRKRVYFAARDGMSLTLYALLFEKTTSEVDDLLNQPVTMDGVSCTPLVAAARHGHEAAVRILLEKFLPPVRLEAEASVRFEEHVISGATALWAAAGAGHLRVVKRLAKAGAQLDHATATASTPLRAACFDGRLDIVRYLVMQGADLHRPNLYNNTCLMIASYKGHLDIVSFLLERGARVDERALCGATALHFAAECGHLEVVKELLNHGAKLWPNEHGMTPLICAAERTRRDVVELLIEQPEVTREESIKAMELLGASFANDKEFYCLSLAFMYMRRSMEMREGNGDLQPVPRVPAPPVPAYDNWRECTTLQELEAISEDANALHMEGLAVRERVLGRACPELPHPVVFRGAVFADNARFDRCRALWGHALALRQENQVPVVKDLLRFAQVFSQMIHIGIDLPVDQVVAILDACTLELQRNRKQLDNPGPRDDYETLMEEYEGNIRTALYLIALIARLLAAGEVEGGGQRGTGGEGAKAAVYRAAKTQARLRDGQTLLHLALNPNTPVDDFHTNDVCKFPCPLSCRLLLECGAEPNSQDIHRDTPLHYAARAPPSSCNEDEEGGGGGDGARVRHALLTELLKHGAHADTVNADGYTPADLVQPGGAEYLLKRLWRGRLACMAAQVISRHNLPYRGHVPTHLHSFIQLHGHQE